MDSVSVYLHVPFCKSICTYCDFCKVLYNKEWAVNYLKVLKLDMKKVGIELGKVSRGLIVPILYGVIINFVDIIKCNYISIFVWGCIYLMVYFVSMWIFALNKEEKDMVKRLMVKLRRVV